MNGGSNCRCVHLFDSARRLSSPRWPWVPVRYLQTLAHRLPRLARNRQVFATSQRQRSSRLLKSGTRRSLLRWESHRFLVVCSRTRKPIVFYGYPRFSILLRCEFFGAVTTTASKL